MFPKVSRLIASLASFVLIVSAAHPALAQESVWCDGFEGGMCGWSSVQLTQQVVSQPVHGGGWAVELQGCESIMQRAGFSSALGEYSAWFRQENQEGLGLYIQVQPYSSADPNTWTCYRLGSNATGGQVGWEELQLTRYEGAGAWRILGEIHSPLYSLGQWARVFVRQSAPGAFEFGYEYGDTVVSQLCTDANPIVSPGAFCVTGCSRGGTPLDYVDDVCYESLPCFDRGADINCDGVAGDVFDVIAAIEIAFSGGTVKPCASKP